MGLYSIASLFGFILMIYGFGQIDRGPLVFAGPSWGRSAAFLLMAIAFVSLAAAYMPKGYIKSWIQHPMIFAVGIWALAHLLTGVEQHEVILFGAFFVYGVIDYVASIRRPASATPPRIVGDLLAVVIGLGAYAAFLSWGHAFLFGVSPV